MSAAPEHDQIVVTEGLQFAANACDWQVPDLVVEPGQLIALSPMDTDMHVNTAVPLAHILATLDAPPQGHIELFGHDVYAMRSGARRRLRGRIGYVHGDGGLLSNRTIFQNVALPYSVHRRPSPEQERVWVDGVLAEFGLTPVADLRPHLVNGLVRWRACLARSVVLDPAWLVIEGPKDWSESWPAHACWSRLQARRDGYGLALAICLPRENHGFEQWFESVGGRVVHCRQLAGGHSPVQHGASPVNAQGVEP